MSRYEKMNLEHQREVEEALVQMVLSKRKFYISHTPKSEVFLFQEMVTETCYENSLNFYSQKWRGKKEGRIYFARGTAVAVFSKLPKRVVQLLAITHREVYEFYKKYWMQNG